MKTEYLTLAEQHHHHHVPRYTATYFPIHTPCEQMVELHQRLVHSAQFTSTVSTSYCQTIPRDLQSPLPPDQLSYTMVDQASFEAGLMVHPAVEYNCCCFSGTSVQSPICWGNASFSYTQAFWLEYGSQLICSATPDLPCNYSTPLPSIEGELVQTGRSPDIAVSSNLSTWDSDSEEAGLVESFDDDAVAGSRGSERAQEGIRTTPPTCSEERIDSRPCPPCKPFQCLLEAQKPQEKEVCGRSFVRIEHLRRHVSTVHGNSRTMCKVPRCRKSFSRCDNLYEHYWTHVYLGRPGRNRKLSLMELEEILGSRDKRIFRILKDRMKHRGQRLPNRRDRRRRRDCITGVE
jgi:hypothetical protein